MIHTSRLLSEAEAIIGSLYLNELRLRAPNISSFISQLIACHSQHRRRDNDAECSDYMEWELSELFGVDKEDSPWRTCHLNKDYSLCSTYPHQFAVPKSISDTVVKHAANHRVKNRLPILAYVHPSKKAVLVRSGQPLIGLSRKRSIQDEHLIDSFRTLNHQSPDRPMLIIDARPTVNAIANTLTGAGFEPLEWYKQCSRAFVNLENIHHIRAAFFQLLEGDNVQWNGHIERLLTATRTIVEVVQQGQSCLIHCSDGWDRTSQLVSLSKICLNKFYRTKFGLTVLIHNDWLAAGHKFNTRLMNSSPLVNSFPVFTEKNSFKTFIANIGNNSLDEWCPIFPQFLDCLARLVQDHPNDFDYGLEYLRDIYTDSMTNRTGMFGSDCERARRIGSSWQVIENKGLTKEPVVVVPDRLATSTCLFKV